MNTDNKNQQPFGSGPGPQTQDGCSVELYQRFPYLGELDALLPHIKPTASILELGCGAGRLTHILYTQGWRPTVVDNSQDMLDAIPLELTKIKCDIERLNLSKKFDVVLLASNIINTSDIQQRNAIVECCKRHLGVDGQLLVERHLPEQMDALKKGQIGEISNITSEIKSVQRKGSLFEMSIEYRQNTDIWLHSFHCTVLSDEAILALIRKHELTFQSWIGSDHKWFRASLSD